MTEAQGEELRDLAIEFFARIDAHLHLARTLPSFVELRSTAAHMLTAIDDAYIAPVVDAFPRLKPDEETWKRIALHRLDDAEPQELFRFSLDQLLLRLEALAEASGASNRVPRGTVDAFAVHLRR